MKKLILEIFILLFIFFSAYVFIFQGESTINGRTAFTSITFIITCIFLLFVRKFDAVKLIGQNEIINRIEEIEKELNFMQEEINPIKKK